MRPVETPARGASRRTAAEEAATPASAERATEIRAEGIRKAFGEQVVLDGIDLEVRRGEIVAFVGASGGGKTVLLSVLLGLEPATSGRVLVAHHRREGTPLVDLSTLGPDDLDDLRLSWAVVFQKNALLSTTVMENCALWLQEHTDLGEEEIRERVMAALDSVGLRADEVVGKERDELSGGMAKRVAVARAIAVDPVLVFYDEPTTGLDPKHSNLLHELIWHTHRRPRADGARRTTVLVTHDRDLLRRLEPRVVMLHHGRIGFDGTFEEFRESREAAAQEYFQTMPGLNARRI